MKIKYIVLIMGLVSLGGFLGCETTVDEDWSGFGSSAHFPEPHQNDHVAYLAANPDNLPGCQNCHGEDYTGGTTDISCLGCHEALGVTSECNRCHGDPDGDPADPVDQAPAGDETHQAHLTGGENSKAVTCSACHVVPSSWLDDGHIDGYPAEISFSGLAVKFGANPVWDAADESCSSTYCHGDAEPEWDDDEAECGSCHGIPPSTPHYIATLDECYQCHGDVIDENGDIINPELHVNGAVNE